MGLGNWLWSLWDKVNAFIKRFWVKVSPALKEVLGNGAYMLWEKSQTLLMEAVAYVASQGLPTDKAKQDAFKKYMQEKSEIAIDEIKDNDFAIIRDLALAAWKKAQENK